MFWESSVKSALNWLSREQWMCQTDEGLDSFLGSGVSPFAVEPRYQRRTCPLLNACWPVSTGG